MRHARTTRPGKAADGREGSVTMEFVMAAPLVLVLILGCVQFAHIWVARLVVHYAAYCAARAALVTVTEPVAPDKDHESYPRRYELPYTGFDEDFCKARSIARGRGGQARSEAEWAGAKAAAQVCAWIVMGSAGGGNFSIPNWGGIPASDAFERKTRTTVRFLRWNVEATVEHDFALITPLVGQMIGLAMNPWSEPQPWQSRTRDATGNAHKGVDIVEYPHLRLTETVVMPKPYRTAIAAGDWDGFPAGGGAGAW